MLQDSEMGWGGTTGGNTGTQSPLARCQKVKRLKYLNLARVTVHINVSSLQKSTNLNFQIPLLRM